MRALLSLPLLMLLGCEQKVENQTCENICEELVFNCSYDAYPSKDSCMQGCLYKFEQGAKMERAETCIMEAECDTFEIIECEHAEGVDVD